MTEDRSSRRHVLIAILLIGGLALLAFVLPGAFRPKVSRKLYEARADMAHLANAIEGYRADCGAFPGNGEGLRALIVNPGLDSWQGPYVDKTAVAHDVWGTPYEYQSGKGEMRLVSAGPDKEMSTNDDIVEFISIEQAHER